MPAAAVIPAPQVYIYVAAVKKLVVGSACLVSGSTFGCYWTALLHGGGTPIESLPYQLDCSVLDYNGDNG